MLLRPPPTGFHVERVGEHEFRLSGRDVERVVALNDVTTPEATGVHQPPARADRRAQAARPGRREDGDTVRIGNFSFEYQGVT